VDTVVFTYGTNVVKTITLPAPSVSDTTIQLSAPDMASLIGSFAERRFVAEYRTVTVGLADATAPSGAVISNSSPFGFALPRIARSQLRPARPTTARSVGATRLSIDGQGPDRWHHGGVHQWMPTSRPNDDHPACSRRHSDTTITSRRPDLSALIGSDTGRARRVCRSSPLGYIDVNAPGGAGGLGDLQFDFPGTGDQPRVIECERRETRLDRWWVSMTITGFGLTGRTSVDFKQGVDIVHSTDLLRRQLPTAQSRSLHRI